jgi:Ca2+-binding RTX toxin-like protein
MVLVTAAAGSQLSTGFNFDRLTDLDSVIAQKSSSSLVILVDGLRYAFSGSNVRYNSFDEPIGGTITGITISSGSSVVFQVSGLSIPAATFYQATFAPNNPLASLVLNGNDELRGGDLNDGISDRLGHNILMGGAGSDVIEAGDGNDHIYGQSPSGGPDGGDLIFAGGGSDYVNGNAGADTIWGGDGSDRIQGGADDDQVRGEAGNDTINGNRGNDSVDGGDGNDSLRGGQGDDTIDGGAGNDIFSGDIGQDRLSGGSGADIFVFTAGSNAIDRPDRIADFEKGVDRLSIGFRPEALLANTTVQSSFAAAGTTAQQMIDARTGVGEVAFLSTANGTFMFWASAGQTIDSAVQLIVSGQTPPSPSLFTTGDFI